MAAQSYEIVFTEKAQRELGKIASGDRKAAARIVRAVAALAANPRPPGVKPLKGAAGNVYRIKAARDYRIIYSIEDSVLVVEVVRIGHRREVYELFFR